MRRRLLVIPALTLLTLLAGAPAALATPTIQTAAAQPGTPTQPSYTALGDSYSAGVGTRVDEPSSGACRRSPLAYPPEAARIQHLTLTFLACSGATTADVATSQLPAMPATADLVTITVGGDDVGFSPVLQACSTGTPAQCSAAVAAGRSTAAQILPARLDALFAQIHARAPHARLLVLGYPHLFGSGACTAFGLPPAAARAAIDAGTDLLDTVIGQHAHSANATFLDVRARFQTHGTCADLLHRWINPPTLPPSDSYHPNIAGQGLGYLPALLAAAPAGLGV